MNELIGYHLPNPIKITVSIQNNKNGQNVNENNFSFETTPFNVNLDLINSKVISKLKVSTEFQFVHHDLTSNHKTLITKEWQLESLLENSTEVHLYVLVKEDCQLPSNDMIYTFDELGKVAVEAGRQTQLAASALFSRMEKIVLNALQTKNSIEEELECSDEDDQLTEHTQLKEPSKGIRSTRAFSPLTLPRRHIEQLDFYRSPSNQRNHVPSLGISPTDASAPSTPSSILPPLFFSNSYSISRERLNALDRRQLCEFFDDCGRLRAPKRMRYHVFTHGAKAEVRPLVWKYLLGLYSPEASATQRLQIEVRRRETYEAQRALWQARQGEECIQLLMQQVRNQLLRIDLTHPQFTKQPQCINQSNDAQSFCNKCNTCKLLNVLVTYCVQNNCALVPGASDLASLSLIAMQKEYAAYVAFIQIMKKTYLASSEDEQRTFMRDQLRSLGRLLLQFDPILHSHLRTQQAHTLIFAYRWLHLQLKREFTLSDSLHVFEVLLAAAPSIELAADAQVQQVLRVQSIDTPDTASWTLRTAMRSLVDTIQGTLTDKRMRSILRRAATTGHSCEPQNSRSIPDKLDNRETPTISCKNLTSTHAPLSRLVSQRSFMFNELPLLPPSDLCDDLDIFEVLPINASAPPRPHRSIRFLPKLLSTDSNEMIDSPDAFDQSPAQRFMFPTQLMQRQLSADSIDCNGLTQVQEKTKLTDSGFLARQSSSFEEKSSKKAAVRTYSAGPTRKSSRGNSLLLRGSSLNQVINSRPLQSLPSSPLLKKRQESFENSHAMRLRAPERCESVDVNEPIVHCSGDQCSQRSLDNWAPLVGLLDQLGSFDAEEQSTGSVSQSHSYTCRMRQQVCAEEEKNERRKSTISASSESDCDECALETTQESRNTSLLLICSKSKLENDETKLVTETSVKLNSDNPFILFVCLSLIINQRELILAKNMDMRQISTHFDRLMRKNNVQSVLSLARYLMREHLIIQKIKNDSTSI